MGSEGWTNVTSDAPCPICGKPDWCSVSEDGSVALCRREDNGRGTYKVDQAGVGYWYHRLDGHPSSPGEQVEDIHSARSDSQEVEPADAATRDVVYAGLFDKLSLSGEHRESLRRRGLRDEEIGRGGYRSLPGWGREEIAGALAGQFGAEVVSKVPGFYKKEGGGWTLAGAAGLVIPVRDVEGRIVALKVRADGEGSGPRYSYVSSKGYGGPGPGAPVHVPRADGLDRGTVRITEGS